MKKLLLFGMLAFSGLSFGQIALTQNFDSVTFPPTGWTVESTNATNNWMRTTTSILGAGSAAVNWIAQDQDESLISPSFSLAGYTTAYLNFSVSVGYEYMVDPFPAGNLFAKISTDGGLTWNQLWVEEDQGEYDDYDTLYIQLNLSAYVGQANAQVKFQYVANDADTVKIDDVSISSSPTADLIGLTALTDNTATIAWTGTGTSYDIEWGTAGFTQGTGTLVNQTATTFDFAGLAAGSPYTYYVRSRSGLGANDAAAWQGPYTFYTSLSTTTAPDYAFGFEVPLYAGGWSAPAPASGGAWGRSTASGALVQDGTGVAAAFGATGAGATASDAWMFSRGLNLVGGTTVTIKYYIREYKAAGNGGINNLAVKIGTAATVAGQTTAIATHTNVGAATAALDAYVLQTSTYVVPTTGVYFLGFNYTSPIHTTVNNGALLVDAVSVTLPLGVGEFADSFSVFPNPSHDVISIANSKNVLVQGITIADLNGRIVKQASYDNVTDVNLNISDLAAGMYMMSIASDKGITTKKIVKK